MQSGTVANHGRAEHLIASVAVAIGRADEAARHAARYAELIETHPAAFTDWDRAFAAEAAARVAAHTGDEAAPGLKAEAYRWAAAIADSADQEIVMARLASDPW